LGNPLLGPIDCSRPSASDSDHHEHTTHEIYARTNMEAWRSTCTGVRKRIRRHVHVTHIHTHAGAKTDGTCTVPASRVEAARPPEPMTVWVTRIPSLERSLVNLLVELLRDRLKPEP